MNAFALAGALTGLSSLGSGIFVFSRAPTQKLNQLWLAFSVAVTSWGFGSMWIALEIDPTRALLAWRLSFAFGVLGISILFFRLVCTFCQVRYPRLLVVVYGIGFLQLPVIFTDVFFSGVRLAFSSFYYAVPGPFFPVFVVFWFGLIAVGHRVLWKAYREASPLRRKQIASFSLATALGFTGGSFSYLPFYHIDLYPWGHFAIPIGQTMMAYAMLKYRVMDVAVVLEKGLSFLTVFAVAGIPALGALTWAQVVYFGGVNIQFTLMLASLFLIVALGPFTLMRRTEQVVGQTLFKGRHQTAESLSTFSRALVTILDFKALTQTIVNTLVHVMALRSALLYILDQEKPLFVQIASAGKLRTVQGSLSFKKNDSLPALLNAKPTTLVREELEYLNQAGEFSDVIQTMQNLEAEVCVPLMNKGRLLGFCLLGARSGFDSYSNDDLELLTTLAHEAAIALDNALLYEDLKRSQSLLWRTDRLRSLEIMAGGFAHEIRNPLTSIKTFVELAPDRSGDQDFLRHFGTVVFEDVARIERLTQEILDYARQEGPRLQEEDLNEIVNSCLYLFEVRAGGKPLIVEKQFHSGLPSVKVDRQQMKQVFLNVLFNALESMLPDGGTLRVKTHFLAKGNQDHHVQVEIEDTGCGIHSDNLEHIFDPFFTTKHESHEREGTGLGLTIAHQIIREHGGKIEVQSIPSQGSTFLVTLPTSAKSFQGEVKRAIPS